ncbi:hypothetical protein HDU76_003334, partial [Blyttiomyces sp. JEL0837]
MTLITTTNGMAFSKFISLDIKFSTFEPADLIMLSEQLHLAFPKLDEVNIYLQFPTDEKFETFFGKLNLTRLKRALLKMEKENVNLKVVTFECYHFDDEFRVRGKTFME